MKLYVKWMMLLNNFNLIELDQQKNNLKFGVY